MVETARTKATAQALDFTNVKEGSGFNKKRMPAGDYVAKITRVEDSPSKKDNEPQWLFTITLEDAKSVAYPYYCKLVENQLWKLRNLIQACGIAVPRKKIKLDPERLVGKLIGVTLEDDEYDGKLQSTIAAIFEPSEVVSADTAAADEDDDDDEDEPAPVTRKKVAPAPVEDDDEDEDEEEAPPAKPAAKKKAAPVEDDDLDELDLDDL
jgi:hypothetical protein